MKDTLLIGISGSIAAYKIADLIRNLQKNPEFIYKYNQEILKPRIQVIMTQKATQFAGPLTFAAITGNTVYYGRREEAMIHIELKNRALLYLVAPASADIIGKMANGIADDIVTTTYLAAGCQVMIAPAMNPNMYNHPAVQRNLNILDSDGVIIIKPEKGEVICGDSGEGRLADIRSLESEIIKILNKI